MGLSTAEESSQPLPFQTKAAIYATGVFCISAEHMMGILVAYWAVMLGAGPFVIGIIVGARHVLSMFLAIHGGALMDRLGVRRVMLFFALIGALTPILHPFLPWIWALVILQMFNGLATAMGWMGAQTLIGQTMKGDASHAGRLSFAVRVGTLTGPPLIGFVWDTTGPWGAFSAMSLWSSALLVAILMLPKPQEKQGEETPKQALQIGDVLPKLSDYIEAFKLLATPTIFFVVTMSLMRLSGVSIQNSFYIVFLNGIGLSATLTGSLFTIVALVGMFASLSVGPLSRIFSPFWILLATIITGIASIAISPLIPVFYALALASVVRGIALAISQPMMISVLSKSADAGSQGKAVGLRSTLNRVAQTFIPILMGTIGEILGIEASFLIVGGILIAMTAIIGFSFKSKV